MVAFAAEKAGAQQKKQPNLASLYLDYGVPSSPAFELLPDKPSDVTHVTTARDLAVQTSHFISGSHLKTGIGLDFRPFAGLSGRLHDYEASRINLQQLAWRSVLSVGSAGKSGDALFSVGLRVPLLDMGDPRANREFINRIETAYENALDSMPQCPLRAVCKTPNADTVTKTIREEFFRDHWNSFRLDVGAAWMGRADSGSLKRDSLSADRTGFWVASAIGLGRMMQLTGSVRPVWIAARQRGAEKQRTTAGGNLRIFPATWIALSVEAARTQSLFRDSTALNESWTHFAGGIEVRINQLHGWVGAGFGGDTSHRSDPGARLSLQYAYSAERTFKQ